MPRPKSTPRLLVRKSPRTQRKIASEKSNRKTVTCGVMGASARARFEAYQEDPGPARAQRHPRHADLHQARA